MPNAIDIATGRDAPATLGMLTQVITATPLFNAFDMRTSPFTRFSTLALVGLPAGGFVRFGAGFKMGTAALAMREFDCSYIGAMVKAQVDVANRWAAEHRNVGYDYFTLQASTRLQADLIRVEKQIIYGTAIDPLGFPGLKQVTPGTLASNVMSVTDTADDIDYTKTVINAGGNAAGAASSAYGIVFGELDVQLVMGNDSTGSGELFVFGERRITPMAPDSTKPDELADHETGQYAGHIGLAVAGFSPVAAGDTVPSQYSLRRLMNLTPDDGCGLDDYKMEKLLLSFPDGKVPAIFAMSSRSGDQWAKSRKPGATTIFVGGQGGGRAGTVNIQPERPRDYAGIPIVYTRAIRNNDAIEVPA